MIKHYKKTESYQVEVIKPFFFQMAPTKVGDVITVPGNLYIDLITRKCVIDYFPPENLPDAINNEQLKINNEESSDVSPLTSDDSKKKLGPKKRRTKKVKE